MTTKTPFLTLILLALWPFISFLNNNQDDTLVYGANVSSYALVFGLSVLLIALLGILLFGRARATAVAHVCGIASVLLFSYLPLSSFLSGFGISLGTVRIAIWALLSLLILYAVWRLARSEASARVLLAAAGVMVIVPVVGLVMFAVSGTETKTEKIEIVQRGGEARRENVYWFIFDAYARADTLADYFGYDNSAFVRAL